MNFTYDDLKKIHEGLLALFAKKDSDIDALGDSTLNSSDTLVVLHNDKNKRVTIGKFIEKSGIEDMVDSKIADKQDTLVSGVNIKTLNGTSLLGEGNINVTFNQVQSNWNENDSSSPAYIVNKPAIQQQLNNDYFDKKFYIDYIKSTNDLEQQISAIKSNSNYSTDTLDSRIVTFDTFLAPIDLEDTSASIDLTPFIVHYIREITNQSALGTCIKLHFIIDANVINTAFIDLEATELDNVNFYGSFNRTSNKITVIQPQQNSANYTISIIYNDDTGIYKPFMVICENNGSVV